MFVEETEKPEVFTMSKVYHAIKPDFRDEGQSFPDDYEMVAEVDSNDLNHIYELTNHIFRDWTTGGLVKPVRGHLRSTSVGDIVELEDGTRHLCQGMGWKEL